MKRISTQFGPLYMETWAKREEADRVKLFDSKKKYLDYFTAESIDETARFKGIAPQEYLDEIADNIKNCPSVDAILRYLVLGYELVTKKWQKIAQNLEIEAANPKILLEDEWVNVIGDYYIQIFVGTHCVQLSEFS